MLSALKFVQGSVAKRETVPTLTHFKIEQGYVRGYNGMLALCSPIPLDIECMPRATPLVHAIGKCDETAQLSMTAAGRLSIKSGNFKAFIECLDDAASLHVVPEGNIQPIDGAVFLQACKTLQPFIGDDASRPWSNGVLLAGSSAYATNNIIAVEYWTGVPFPLVANVPRLAVNEILRIKQAPHAVQATTNSITFHYPDGRWLRSQLLDLSWPDIRKLLDVQSNPVPLPENFFKGIETVKEFVGDNGSLRLEGNQISTGNVDDEGAAYTIEGMTIEPCCYSHAMLMKLKNIAVTADFTEFPRPAYFFGDRLRGTIIGMRPRA